MIRKVLGTFLLLFLAEISTAQETKQQWVDSVYNTLTLDQRLGQLFIFPAHGSGSQQHINVIKSTNDRYTLGGVKIMDGSAKSVIELNNQLKSNSSIPLLTALNSSNSSGYIVSNTLQTPNPLTLAAVSSDSLLIELAKLNTRHLKGLGVNMVLQDGLGISTRTNFLNTFGDDPERASSINRLMAQAYSRDQLIYSTTYFLGKSDINTKKAFEKTSEVFFKPPLGSEISAVIISNDYTPLDNKNIAPLSKNTITYLRAGLDFDGLILADELSNIKKYKPGKTEARAIESGCDMIISSNIGSAIKQVRRYIRKEDIPLAQIERSVKKVLSAKYDIQPSWKQELRSSNVTARFNNGWDKAFINYLYGNALTAVDSANTLPIEQIEDKTFASLSIGNIEAFQKNLNRYAVFNHYNLSTSIEELTQVLPLFDYVVVGVSESIISNKLISLLNSLKHKVIICSFGQPFSLTEFDPKIAQVISYQYNETNQKKSAELIFGATENQGKLPLTINRHLTMYTGESVSTIDRLSFSTPETVLMDSKILDKINEVVIGAIQDEATPGCQVIVARRGKIVFDKSYGYHTYDSLQPITSKSIYDIASITKVAATTQAIMMLEERGLIDLDKKISVYLQELKGTNKENMTIRDILTHQSGLWPYLPFWKETITDETFSSIYYSFNADDDYPYELSEGVYVSNITRDSVWQWVKKSKLRRKEKSATYDYKYSDMGYYMLQRLIEQLVNQPMEEFLQQNLYDPMGLSTMSYLPLCKFPQDIIAPTEKDNYFRKSLVNGWVHDQGAAMMGGVAGHAGLFSNALDLAKLMQMHLQKGVYGGQRYYMPETLEKFTKIQYESNRRGIGWDKPVVGEWNSPTSIYASKKSFGHTGFTGTAVWADPEFDLIYVFLSNRIYPDASNRKLIKNNIRTRIQDLIYQSIWSYAATHSDSCN